MREQNNITHIVIAKSRRTRWSELLRGSVTHHLIRRAGDISVHVIAEPPGAEVPESQEREAVETAARPASFELGAYGVSAGDGSGGARRSGCCCSNGSRVANVSLVFLTAVLASAVAYGLWPALFACFVSVLAYNFFFLPPLYTFTIADPENMVALFFFAVRRLDREQPRRARPRARRCGAGQRAKTTEELYQFSRKLAAAVTLDDLLWATAYQVALMLKVRVVLLLPEGDSIAVRAGYPPEDALDEADLAAAKWCWHQQPAGRARRRHAARGQAAVPADAHRARRRSGVVGLDSDRPGPLLTPDQRRLLDALVDQAALAIERVNLAQRRRSARRLPPRPNGCARRC